MNREEQLNWKAKIRQWAIEVGFSAIGFANSEPIEGLKKFLEERREAGFHTPFEEKDVLRRVDARLIWPSCKTVVVLAYPLPLTRNPQEREGVLSRSAVGEDYHSTVKKRCNELITSMENAGWRYEKPRIQIDTGPLNERAFALKAGIGWIGRNQQLIIPEVGSFVSLALLLLDQELGGDEPMQVGTVLALHQMPIGNQCGGCRKCVEACPAQILGKAEFAANQCLSYFTQSKEVLSKEQVTRLDKRLFGCDTCQEVCPHNQSWLRKEESSESTLTRGEDLWRVLNLTKGEFNKRFNSTAASWRGKGILQRNAYLALKLLEAPRLSEWEKERKKEGIPPLIQPYVRE